MGDDSCFVVGLGESAVEDLVLCEWIVPIGVIGHGGGTAGLRLKGVCYLIARMS